MELPSISIDVCKGQDYCKTEEEIKNFVKGKILMIFTKSKTYNPESYDQDVVTEKINFYYFELNVENPKMGEYKITKE